jgi:hypothetical protein
MTVATGLRYVSLQFRAGFDACHPQDRRLVKEMLFDYTHYGSLLRVIIWWNLS